MPLKLYQDHCSTQIAVWEITEPIEFFTHLVEISASDQMLFDAMNDKRKLEWLAARHLLMYVREDWNCKDIWKDEFGKPHMAKSKKQISISHSRNHVAVLLSDFHSGIDIQHYEEKIGRIAHKFVSETEKQFLDNDHRLLEIEHLIWGTKESMYKAWGKRGIDFRKDMQIKSIDWDGKTGKLTGCLEKRNITMKFDVIALYFNHYYLIYATEKSRIIDAF